MRTKRTLFVGIIILGLSILGATQRELGKLYLVVEKVTRNVVQMGISEGSVLVEDSGTQELAIIDGEKPSHLSENHFKFVAGKLVDMTAQEKAQVNAKIQTEKEDIEVAHLKAIMARDPAGFRAILGL